MANRFYLLQSAGWCWYYLSAILDDYSRFIVHWELCKTMKAEDVERTIEAAMLTAGLKKDQRPKLLSDNGACYVAAELKTFLKNNAITQVHGRLCHPQTQGKIERYHRSVKNVVKLDHYYCREEINQALKDFVHYYNHHAITSHLTTSHRPMCTSENTNRF